MNKELRFFVLVLFVLVSSPGFSQKKKKSAEPVAPAEKRYKASEVRDSSGQILIYNCYMELLGDSLRNNAKGLPIEGWKEDYYEGAKILHKGYYKAGKLSMFKNFYENGKVERVFARIDSLNTNLEVFYENGNQREQINYVQKEIKRHSEFFENGLLKQSEEYNPKNSQLLKRKLWFSNGTLNEELSLTDPKSMKYQHRIYHNNGKLAESGWSYLRDGSPEIIRSGTWNILDSTGTKKKSKVYPSFK